MTIDSVCSKCPPIKWAVILFALVLLVVGLLIEWVCTGRLPNKLG